MEKKTIGSFISALRRAAGMTQRDLAEQLNVSDKAVSRWERDESAPDLTLLPLIADLFGITVDELLRGQRRNIIEQPSEQPATETDGYSTPQITAFATQFYSKRQKMLFGNRLRKQKILNYIPLGLFAGGVIAALLCNFAFYRAALGFFLGLLLEVAAVICALAFARAALPVSEEDYDPELLLTYKKDVIRTAYLPIYLAAITLPLFLFLLFTWLEFGAYVGAASSELLAMMLITLLVALLLREIGKFAILPAIERRVGIAEDEREHQRRRNVGKLAKRCAITTVCAIILPIVAMGVLSCGMFDPDTDFTKGTTFDNYEDFAAHMADQSKNGETRRWAEDYSIRGDVYYALMFEIWTDGDDYVYEVVAPSDQSASELLGDEEAEAPDNSPHRVITDISGKVQIAFDWLNTNVGAIRFSFDQSEDGMPVTVYSVDDLHTSHAIYDTLVALLGALIAAVPLVGITTYAMKRRKI